MTKLQSTAPDAAAGQDQWVVPTWEEVVTQPLRQGLPARVSADRKPVRRRGPHPGGVRPGLPFAGELQARHAGRLAAPDHHQPLPGPGPAQEPDPLRRARRRRRVPAARPGPRARSTASNSTTSTSMSRPRSKSCPRTSAPPSCSATSRGCPTTRSPQPWTSSWALSGRASTAAGPCFVKSSRTGIRAASVRA